MSTKWMQTTGIGAIALAALASGCGDVVRQGRAPVQLVINALEAASGAEPDEVVTTLLSDVQTLVERSVNGEPVLIPTTFNDMGLVTMSLILKDPGQSGIIATPSALNQVTISRYRVEYRRTDGRRTQGVDVPYSFDSAVTFTVPTEGTIDAGFEIVRHTAKQEAPLAALTRNPDIIATIADVTFYGRDQADNDISVTGTIGINFGNFADPE